MADLYANYAQLAAAQTLGVDYAIRSNIPAGATWASTAIHGGGIEAGSGEIAEAVAGNRMAYYEFDGMKSSNNVDLHITSTNFDEPTGLALIQASRRSLSFHGFAGTAGVLETAVGGLDTPLTASVSSALTAAGFSVITSPSEIAGTNPANFCNRTSIGAGVQLEMSNALRQSFFTDFSRNGRKNLPRTEAFYRYVAAVQSVYTGQATMALNSVNVSRYATIAAPSANMDIQATLSTDALAVGGSHFPGLVGRFADTNNTYIARLEFSTTQTVILTIRKRVTSTESLITQFTTGLTHAAGTKFRIRFQMIGTALRARAWLASGTEPGTWQIDTTDTSLTAPGSVGMRGILSTTNTNPLPVTVTWDDFSATPA